MTYDIHEANIDRLTKKLTTIRNKCLKLGCEFSFEQLGEVFKTVTDEETGHKHIARFITVEVSGRAHIADWEFVATIEHADPINIIRSFNPDVEIPVKYYTAPTYCDHCHTKRARKDTYIIRNTKTGEFKQVGKSCLKEFTNGLSAEAVASCISWYDELIRGEAPVMGYTTYYEPLEVLQYAVESVKLYGFVPTSAIERDSTKTVVLQQMRQFGAWQDRITEDGFNVDAPGNKEMAKNVLDWVNGLEDEFGYVSNLKAACNKPGIETRDIGLVVSAVASYNKAMQREARIKAEKEAAAKSTHFGTVGQRVELHDLAVKRLASWDSMYGYTFLWKLTDKEGHTFVWKTSTWLCDERGCDDATVVSLKATIKAHSEYNGELQTELTRCKVL